MLTKIIKYEKKYSRVLISFFKNFYNMKGITFKFRFVSKYKNRFISLGTNCYTRTILTKYGLKPRKKEGELSCPFDLCYSSLDAILHYLNNDFEDFFNNLEVDNEKYIWVNKDTSLIFPHDNFNSNTRFYERYFSRIKNFLQLYKTEKKIFFITTLFEEQINSELVNKIYQILHKKMHNKNFKYVVVHFYSIGDETNYSESLNDNIIFKSIKIDDKIENYYRDWILPDVRNLESVQKMEDEFLNIVYNTAVNDLK